MSHSKLCWVACTGALVILTACGGGSDSASTSNTSGNTNVADPVDKYVGTWSACLTVKSGGSDQNTITATKTSATTINFSGQDIYYTSADCTGTPADTVPSSAQATHVGTKQIGTDTVDKWNVQAPLTTFKTVTLVANGQITFGLNASDGGAVDAEGFPTTWDMTLNKK